MTTNHTILIVDDEDDLRELIAYRFKNEGFNVLEANCGQQAFEIVKSNKIDLIISDMQMPNGNGMELLNNIKQLGGKLPVLIFMTGFSNTTLYEAYELGADAVFSKPFDQNTLLSIVTQSLAPKNEMTKVRPWRGEATVTVKISRSNSNNEVTAQIENLGRGGFFASLDDNLPNENEQIDFNIHFNEGALITIQGQGIVKWTRKTPSDIPTGFGLEFTNLNEHSKKQIVNLINYIKTKQHVTL